MHTEQDRHDPVTGQPADVGREMIETKEFFRTSEFWVLVLATIAIVVTALVSDVYDASQAWGTFTWFGVAYIVSRGIAKAGEGHPFRGRTWPHLAELWNRDHNRYYGYQPDPYFGRRPEGYIEQRPDAYAGQPQAEVHPVPHTAYAQPPMAPDAPPATERLPRRSS